MGEADKRCTVKRFRCHFCAVTLPAWYPVPGEPSGAMLLHHVAQSHPAELRLFLDQMHVTDDTTLVIVQAFGAVDTSRLERRCGELTRGPAM